MPPDAADFLASATLWPFHKDDPARVARYRAQARGAFTPQVRPVAVSSVLVRLTRAFLLIATVLALSATVGSSQHCIKTRNGVEAILFGVNVARECGRAWTLQLDVANDYNELSRQRLW